MHTGITLPNSADRQAGPHQCWGLRQEALRPVAGAQAVARGWSGTGRPAPAPHTLPADRPPPPQPAARPVLMLKHSGRCKRPRKRLGKQRAATNRPAAHGGRIVAHRQRSCGRSHEVADHLEETVGQANEDGIHCGRGLNGRYRATLAHDLGLRFKF